jgi:hypothetical protein
MLREHRHALAGLDAGMVSACLTDPDTAISDAKASCAAGTNLGGDHFPDRTGYQTRADGIHIGGSWTGDDDLFVITWRQIAALARDIPTNQREELRESCRRLAAHQVTAPTYGPHLTATQRNNLHERVYPQWLTEHRALRQVRDDLLTQALGLDDTEPHDLLELLAADTSDGA